MNICCFLKIKKIKLQLLNVNNETKTSYDRGTSSRPSPGPLNQGHISIEKLDNAGLDFSLPPPLPLFFFFHFLVFSCFQITRRFLRMFRKKEKEKCMCVICLQPIKLVSFLGCKSINRIHGLIKWWVLIKFLC